MHVDIIETKSLDDRSYLGIGGIVAVVIDPQRDLDRVLLIVQVQGVDHPCAGDPPAQVNRTGQGKRVLLRGLELAQNEWNLLAGCHNLMKLFTMQSNAQLAASAGA